MRRPGIEPREEWESCMIPLHQRRLILFVSQFHIEVPIVESRSRLRIPQKVSSTSIDRGTNRRSAPRPSGSTSKVQRPPGWVKALELAGVDVPVKIHDANGL